MAGPSILVVDDERNILSSLSRMLELEDFAVLLAGGGEEGLRKVAEHTPDLVLLDVKMPDKDGLEVLRAIKDSHPDLPVVLMSGHGDIETAIRAIRLGAHDFIEKPLASDKILITIRNALQLGHLTSENRALRAEMHERYRLVGRSAALQRLRDTIARAAPSVGAVLVRGESGTGKELVARAIHEGSRRATKPFIKLNCAAIPHDLIESELFGHERGAFTGAHQRKKGKFELADGGTLFLDEIGDMRTEVQAKLLRVLQEGEFERVGGQQVQVVDVRIVAATNKDLEAEIVAGRFREDLYYRINVIPIWVPPLRGHPEDIPELLEHFLKLACRNNDRRPKLLTAAAREQLCSYPYPGNVRELRNTCERLVILTPGDVIEAEHVRTLVPLSGVPGGALPAPPGAPPVGAAPARANGAGYRPGVPLRDLVAEAERDFILAALQTHDGHMTHTAADLGLERSHLYKKMRALGIDR